MSKRKATEKRYLRTKNSTLLKELISLSDEIEASSDLARSRFYRDQIDNALNNIQDVWRKLRYLGLLPTPKSDLHGISPDYLNSYFSGVSTSALENIDDVTQLIDNASENGFSFVEMTLNDVILAVAHFSSQAAGDDGIPQKIIAKSLPTIGPILVQFFNASLKNGIFPSL